MWSENSWQSDTFLSAQLPQTVTSHLTRSFCAQCPHTPVYQPRLRWLNNKEEERTGNAHPTLTVAPKPSAQSRTEQPRGCALQVLEAAWAAGPSNYGGFLCFRCGTHPAGAAWDSERPGDACSCPGTCSTGKGHREGLATALCWWPECRPGRWAQRRGAHGCPGSGTSGRYHRTPEVA